MAPPPENARQRGNELYKAGKLVEAEAAYTEASRLAPGDPRPLSNVAAVKFELGNHLGAALFAQKALRILASQTQPDTALEQRLLHRLAKAHLCCNNFAKAKDAVNKISGGPEKQSLARSILSIETVYNLYPSEGVLWDLVLSRISKYKPALQNEAEFFSVGHDAAETEFHDDLAGSSQNSYSMLFCGVGDARNLFATLAYISVTAMSKPFLLSKKFYFTLLDINPAVFARDLLNFRMLADCARETDAKRRITLVTISYVFGLQVMPPWVYERLQTAIRDVLSELRDQKADVLGRFGIDRPTRELISHHLRNWRKVPEGWYSTASILALTREQNLSHRMQNFFQFGTEDTEVNNPPAGCGLGSPDVLGYEDLNVMLPFVDLLEEFEHQLRKIFMEWEKSRRPASRRRLDQYFESNWKPNMTLIDFDWEMSREQPKPLMDFLPHEVVSNLFGHIPAAVAGPNAHGVLAHFVGFFDFIATWSDRIKKQTVFEVVVDDMVAFMERAEHGVLRRDDRFVSINAPGVLDRYDRYT